MLEVFQSGLLALWLRLVGGSQPSMNPYDLALWPQPMLVAANQTPPATIQTIGQTYLKTLASRGWTANNQGIWIQSDSQLLINHQGTLPRSAASLTKLATSLAALETWGPDHRFETRIGATGPIQAGVLQGDLVVEGNHDPFFIWEEAIVLGNALNRLGIQTVTGDLIIVGPFAMNFETDPLLAGQWLQQGMDGERWSEEIQTQYQTLPPNTPIPKLKIQGMVRRAGQPGSRYAAKPGAERRAKPLIFHQSLPLHQLVKLMNLYSNNAMAEILAEAVGGVAVVAQVAAQSAQVPPTEIQLINGSGLGEANRISPRAAVAMLLALHRYGLKTETATDPLVPVLTVADLLPVSGRDEGTITGRAIPQGGAVKTGTLDNVSALAGVLPAKDGLVWFAIINGGNDWDTLRAEQDRLLQAVIQQVGSAPSIPTVLVPLTGDERAAIGADSRNRVMSNP